MNPVQIIGRKRDGRELTRDEIAFFVRGFSSGNIPNYQMAALAMAIQIKGMSAAETVAMTEEMLASGKRLSWSRNIVEDSAPRLERQSLVHSREHAVPVALGAAHEIDNEQEEDAESGLDARDTVDLGEDGLPSMTLMLDGSVNLTFEPPAGSSGRDTVDLEMIQTSTVQLPLQRGAVVDKHSTGGLGDKTSLILAPLLACCGLRVPMISGRGLGSTGGTLDKLESIPGFRTDLSLEEIRDITERVGCVITGAREDIAPADRKLYALRDVTGTVSSIPLITASIMSKKLAERLDALVIDVKWGSGAFMKTLASARKLAELLVETGRRSGVKVSALLTNMDQPLGRMVGNTLEVDEALEALAGTGPADLWNVTCDLAVELLLATDRAPDILSARNILQDHINSGRATRKFREMIEAQGGKPDAPRPRCDYQFEIRATRTGYVSKMNAETLGLAVIELGGGRRVLSDSVDHSVGLEMLVKMGDRVQLGQPLVRVHCRESQEDGIKPLIRAAIPIRPQRIEPPALITERIG